MHIVSVKSQKYAACTDSAYVFILSITVTFHVDLRYSIQSVEETGRPRQEPKIQASTWWQERMHSEAVVRTYVQDRYARGCLSLPNGLGIHL